LGCGTEEWLEEEEDEEEEEEEAEEEEEEEEEEEAEEWLVALPLKKALELPRCLAACSNSLSFFRLDNSLTNRL
tara:strand:+ start:182 stop:403 length:222 start_codon:yes stop_codon:yes gene_type:complete